jgi:hypothetical protein
MPTLADLSSRLREAVASQAYAEAQLLVPEYCALLGSEFRSHHPSSAQARRIAEEAQDLYQWLARAVTVDRAHCAAELQQLARTSAYLEPGLRARHTYQLEG